MKLRNYLFFFAATAIILASLSVVSAGAFNASISPGSINESTNSKLNITINNLAAVQNITQAVITLPANFSFVANTNGTSASNVVFSNTTTLVFSNTTVNGFIQNQTAKSFWFNSTALTPGSYNINVNVTDTAGVYNATNISITVNDTTNPVVNLISPSNNSNLTYRNILFNCTLTDNVALANVVLYIWNSSGSIINSTSTAVTGTSNTSAVNVTLPYDGTFTWNCLANDSSSNSAYNSTNRTVIVDTTVAPSQRGGSSGGAICPPDWRCGEWGQCSGGTQTRTCTDKNSCRTNDSKPSESQVCTSAVLPTTPLATAPTAPQVTIPPASTSPVAQPVTGAAVQPSSEQASRIKSLEMGAAIIAVLAGIAVSIYFIARKK